MSARRRRLRAVVLAVLTVLLPLSVLLGTALGASKIPLGTSVRALFAPSSLTDLEQAQRLIVRELRLPRVVLACLVGAALALSGAMMQGLFRNPLASPYVLGVASGASTGAALVIVSGWQPVPFLPLGAFAGGLLAVLVVYGLASRRDHRTSVFTLILGGVAVGALFSAVTSFLIFLSSSGERMSDVVFWIMGGLGRANWTSVSILAAVFVPCVLGAHLASRDLNALGLGEEGAFHLGVSPEWTKRWALVVATAATSASVAFAGTIGFVGLVIPHIVRLLLGPDHRVVIPASTLAGAVFLLWADLAARTVMRPVELPVGIITAFLGAPFFLYLLRTRGSRL
ncbi:MAG: iron ABC transporter permease [Candidatus Bipolaricaulota bacterium]|nr:MAG: iron ABC transporter permease [Candidatus Bipolaricaulota bacterium]